MGDLTRIGIVLALISGIIAIVVGFVRLLGQSLELLSFGTVNVIGGNFESAIVSIVMGILLVAIYLGRIHIADGLILGIVIIVIGILGGGPLATLGGILILIDYFLVGGTTTRRRRRRRR